MAARKRSPRRTHASCFGFHGAASGPSFRWLRRTMGWSCRPSSCSARARPRRYGRPVYRHALVMSVHMVLGSVALGLGALQFVPQARRSAPRLHRAAGLLVYVATAFHLGMWSLASWTLMLLWHAVAAARHRDFRSHMVWMALVYAGLCTGSCDDCQAAPHRRSSPTQPPRQPALLVPGSAESTSSTSATGAGSAGPRILVRAEAALRSRSPSFRRRVSRQSDADQAWQM
jgi:uncharacterized membrane protein